MTTDTLALVSLVALQVIQGAIVVTLIARERRTARELESMTGHTIDLLNRVNALEAYRPGAPDPQPLFQTMRLRAISERRQRED